MDLKYWALGAIVILALVFIKKLWRIVLLLALAGAAYWYFFVR